MFLREEQMRPIDDRPGRTINNWGSELAHTAGADSGFVGDFYTFVAVTERVRAEFMTKSGRDAGIYNESHVRERVQGYEQNAVAAIEFEMNRQLKMVEQAEGALLRGRLMGKPLAPEDRRLIIEALQRMTAQERQEEVYRGESETLQALIDAPPIVRRALISDTLFEAAKEQRDPEAARALRAWKVYRQAVQGVAEATKDAITGEAR